MNNEDKNECHVLGKNLETVRNSVNLIPRELAVLPVFTDAARITINLASCSRRELGTDRIAECSPPVEMLSHLNRVQSMVPLMIWLMAVAK